jgi:hypothetical protein
MSGRDKRCGEIMNCEPFVPGKLDNRQALVGGILRLSGHSEIGQHGLGSLGVEGNGRVSQESTPSGEKMLSSFILCKMAKCSGLPNLRSEWLSMITASRASCRLVMGVTPRPIRRSGSAALPLKVPLVLTLTGLLGSTFPSLELRMIADASWTLRRHGGCLG